jgi:hypothetical protein
MISDLVTAKHLSRKAMIYIRQSTPQQVMTNQESLRLQYALRQRASDLGWLEMNIEVVDVDLGLSGATSSNREGFKDVIARVTLGEVGIIVIAHPAPASASPDLLADITNWTVSSTGAPLAFAVLTTERKAA